MVEQGLPKPLMWVRFPSPAPSYPLRHLRAAPRLGRPRLKTMIQRLAAALGLLFLVIIGLGLVALLGANLLLDRPEVRALTMNQAERATGWSWSFTSGPQLRWRPMPWISVYEVELATHAPAVPVRIRAEEMRIGLNPEGLLSRLFGIEGHQLKVDARQVAGQLASLGPDSRHLDFHFHKLQALVENPPSGAARVRDLKLSGGALILQGANTETPLMVDDFALSLHPHPLIEGAHGQLSARGQLRGKSGKPADWSADVHIDTGFSPTPTPGIFDLTDVELAVARLSSPTSAGALHWPAFSITGQGTWDALQQSLSLNDAHGQILQLDLGMDLVLRLDQGSPNISGQLRLASVDLRDWAHRLGVDLGVDLASALALVDDSALRSLSANLDVRAHPGILRAESIWLRLDASEAWGRASLRLDDQPTGHFSLSIDQLDLDHYLPARLPSELPVTAQDDTHRGEFEDRRPTGPLWQDATSEPVLIANGAKDAKIAADAWSQPATPHEATAPRLPFWQRLTLTGDLDIGQFRVFGLDAGALGLQPKLADRLLRLGFVAPDFYAGRIHGQLEVAVAETGRAPLLQLLAKAERVQCAPLLTALQASLALECAAEIALDLNAQGADWPSLAQSLGGDVVLVLRDARLKHSPLQALFDSGILGSGAGADRPALDTFSDIHAHFAGTNGFFSSTDVVAQSPMVVVSGTGDIRLPEQFLDFDLNAMLRETADGRDIGELAGVAMPLRIRGDWSDPKVSFDLKPALRAAAARVLQRKLR